MAWKRRPTDKHIYVELDDFDPEQLLQSLIDCECISEGEAEAIMRRRAMKKREERMQEKIVETGINGVAFGDELDRARLALRRGDKSEALHYIERHLGREWIGELH